MGAAESRRCRSCSGLGRLRGHEARRRPGLVAHGHRARRRNRLGNGRRWIGSRCRRCRRLRSRHRLRGLRRLGRCGGCSRRRRIGRRMGMRYRGRSRDCRRRLWGVGSSSAVRRHGRVGRPAGRQERERVDVSLLVRSPSHAQVDVRLRPVGLTTRPGCGHRVSLRDRVASPDLKRSEMLHNDGVAVRGSYRQRLAAFGHRARERDNARGGRVHIGVEVGSDVDPTMLATGVRIAAEHEWPQDLPFRRPRPRLRRSRKHTGDEDEQEEETSHATTPCSRK